MITDPRKVQRWDAQAPTGEHDFDSECDCDDQEKHQQPDSNGVVLICAPRRRSLRCQRLASIQLTELKWVTTSRLYIVAAIHSVTYLKHTSYRLALMADWRAWLMWQIDDLPPLRCTRACDKYYFCFPAERQEPKVRRNAAEYKNYCRAEARVSIILGAIVLLAVLVSICTLWTSYF